MESIVPRKIPSQNIVSRLIQRELWGLKKRRKCSKTLDTSSGFYSNIFPNFTLVNVEKPPCFLRKFTPDGRFFIAFSFCQTRLEIYSYNGPGAAADIVSEIEDESVILTKAEAPEHAKIRSTAFHRFFTLRHSVVLSSGEQLNRECSLFTVCGRFVIVGSATFVSEEPYPPPLHEMFRNNESVTPNPRNPLEDYTIYSVDLWTGLLVDKMVYKTDKIFMSHNQGLYLYGDRLSVLSVQHQTVHLYRIDSEGFFTHYKSIGRFIDEEIPHPSPSRLPASKESAINDLKHRILVFLYKRSVALASEDGHPNEIRKFYQYFDQLKSMRIWKAQILDEDNLLLKYASEDVVTLRNQEPNAQPSFFVVYNISSTEVITIHGNNSETLLEIFENFGDFFRNPIGPSKITTSSPSNNVYANLIQQRFKQTILSAKNGGPTEARKRILAQLPISAQSYTSSPYLDLSLFSYDEKWVSVMERPKTCGEHPITFYGRDSGLLKFKIYAGIQGRHPPPPSTRRLVAFIFHPTDPFAISVQRTNLEYVVNFHVRRPPTN